MEREDIELDFRKAPRKYRMSSEFTDTYSSLGFSQLLTERPNKADFYLYHRELKNYVIGLGVILTVVVTIATIYLRITLGD